MKRKRQNPPARKGRIRTSTSGVQSGERRTALIFVGLGALAAIAGPAAVATVVIDLYDGAPLLYVEDGVVIPNAMDDIGFVIIFRTINGGERPATNIVTTTWTYPMNYAKNSQIEFERRDLSNPNPLGPKADFGHELLFRPTADEQSAIYLIFALSYQDSKTGEPGGFVQYYKWAGVSDGRFRSELRSQTAAEAAVAKQLLSDDIESYESLARGYGPFKRGWCALARCV